MSEVQEDVELEDRERTLAELNEDLEHVSGQRYDVAGLDPGRARQTMVAILAIAHAAHTRGFLAGKASGFIEGKNAAVSAAEDAEAAIPAQYDVTCQKCHAALGTMEQGRIPEAAAGHLASSPECAGVPLGINSSPDYVSRRRAAYENELPGARQGEG